MISRIITNNAQLISNFPKNSLKSQGIHRLMTTESHTVTKPSLWKRATSMSDEKLVAQRTVAFACVGWTVGAGMVITDTTKFKESRHDQKNIPMKMLCGTGQIFYMGMLIGGFGAISGWMFPTIFVAAPLGIGSVIYEELPKNTNHYPDIV